MWRRRIEERIGEGEYLTGSTFRSEGHLELYALVVPYTRLSLSGTTPSRQVPVARVEGDHYWCHLATWGIRTQASISCEILKFGGSDRRVSRGPNAIAEIAGLEPEHNETETLAQPRRRS